MFHDVSHAAARRVRIRAGLPVEHPGVLDEINGLLDRLPDPEHLSAEQRAGSMTHAAGLRNRLDAWLTALADGPGRHTITIDAHGIPHINPPCTPITTRRHRRPEHQTGSRPSSAQGLVTQ